jgi:hypothetical protein
MRYVVGVVEVRKGPVSSPCVSLDLEAMVREEEIGGVGTGADMVCASAAPDA